VSIKTVKYLTLGDEYPLAISSSGAARSIPVEGEGDLGTTLSPDFAPLPEHVFV